MDFKSEIYNNMNGNGGGLATNITGKFESNRHALARAEKYTFGEVVKELAKKKNGGFKISASELLNVYTELFGVPEWHHAGALPKGYGGGMKKTYFLDEIPTAEQVQEWLVQYQKIKDEQRKLQEQEKIKAEKRRKYREKYATRFERMKHEPPLSVVTLEEMQGKYGWFIADYKYNLDIYYSGYTFKSKTTYNNYLKML